MHRMILVVLVMVFLLSGCRRAGALEETAENARHPQTEPTGQSVELTEAAVQTTAPVQTASAPTQEGENPTRETEHTHHYTKTVTAPTCTTDGFTTYTCTCGYSYNSNMVPATGHSWGDWETVKAPTDAESGLQRRTCSVCGLAEDQELKPGTDGEDHSHQFTATVTKPTCTVDGYTTYTCACGYSYVGDTVPATGHSWGEWETVQEPTDTQSGVKKHTCSACRASETAEIPVQCQHVYQKTVTAPTCTAEGFTTYTCSKCGHSYNSNMVQPTGHQYGAWKVDWQPTEEKPGQESRTCAVCQDTQTRQIAYTATGTQHTHQYISQVTAATCTTDGFTTYRCDGCGHSYNSNGTPALGHSWGTWTDSGDGTQCRSCGTCGAVEQIPGSSAAAQTDTP